MGICSQWAAGAPIVFSYSTVSFVCNHVRYTELTGRQYFFAVAGLKDPFLVTIIT